MKPQSQINVLVVSYHFPPSGAVGAKRIAGFCTYLPESGIRPLVLTVDQSSCEILDQSLLPPEHIHVERVTPRSTVFHRYRRKSELRSALPQAPSTNGNAASRSLLKQELLALFTYPDKHRGWYRPAIAAAARLIEKFGVDAIFSSGPPWTSHAVAHTVARRFNLPWTADFRDQWACDPWRCYTGMPKWRDKLDLWTEDRWVRNAVLVVCATNRQREALLCAHPRLPGVRVITIPNGFDRTRYVGPVELPHSGTPRVLLHAGELYGDRYIGTFCSALESLILAGKVSANDVRVRLVGRTSPEIEREGQAAAPELFRTGVVALHPQVDWSTAQQHLSCADILLIFQGNHPTAIPAKFYEYIQTGKPIVAITGEGELRDAVLRTGTGFVASAGDRAGISSALEQALRTPPRSREQVALLAEQFDYRNLTVGLAESFRLHRRNPSA